MKKVLGNWRRSIFNQPYTVRNSVEWIPSGKKYFDTLEQFIDSATHEIHLQTYIFDMDATGLKIAEALIRAALRKTQVYLFVDAYGSQNLTTELINRFKNAGIHFKKYGEIYSHGRFHIGRRMHHKITVFDGQISIVGGINISDYYNDTNGNAPWLDFAVIMRGDISRRLQYICRKRWSGILFTYQQTKKLLKNISFEKINSGYCPIRTRRNDFIRNKNDIAISYREALRNAEKSILLVGGYFLPGGRTRRLMKKAIQRGVKVNVLVSEKSDVKVIIYARRYLYDWLIRNGIGVYEYKKANVHGKVLIADKKWTSIGSFDLNNLSTYSNIELNVDINDSGFSSSLGNQIEHIMQNDCIHISEKEIFSGKTIFTRIRMWFSYSFVKTLFVLSVLLAGKKEKDF